jgi:hypothetical protein
MQQKHELNTCPNLEDVFVMTSLNEAIFACLPSQKVCGYLTTDYPILFDADRKKVQVILTRIEHI